VACLDLQYFSTLSHKEYDFREKVIEHKMFVLILSTTCVWNISRWKKNWGRYYQDVHSYSYKVSLFLPNINETWFFRKVFEKFSNVLKIRPVGAEMFHADWDCDSHSSIHPVRHT